MELSPSASNVASNAPTRYVTVITTAPDEKTSEAISTALVSSKLVACANILPGVKSSYWWKGKVTTDQELMMIMKTKASLIPAISKRLKEVHPYDVPELIVQPIVDGSPQYLAWIEESTTLP